MKPKLLNIIPSAFVFLVSLTIYILTLEPSVSWWDCGEFIAAANGLQVGHPPGAPLFLMLGRFFALFAPSPAHVALMINLLSALASALTVLFLYWTILLLAKKPSSPHPLIPFPPHPLIPSPPVLAGILGSLTYAFTDTFWFSAVEGEVYALSSLFTAVVFWAILRWEREYDEPGSMRWILLIAFLMGLSVGVHLLNLLAIPAIVLIWYFKKYPEPDARGILKALFGSVLLLGLIMYGIIPGVVRLASWFELFFINLFGLPYGSGLVIFVIILIACLTFGIRESVRRRAHGWNTIFLATALLLTGYSSYVMILVRASADPPMNQNKPDNAFTLLSYLNREQYGDRPLIYGPYYNAQRLGQKPGKPVYGKEDGKYKVVDRSWKPVYDKRFYTVFPRMWSGSPDHVRLYKDWGRVEGRPVEVAGPDGKPRTEFKPTFTENLRFFFGYQLGHMYFRYFMWNFAGRQNDTESQGGIRNGNWISGIGFIDSWRLGPQKELPDAGRHNKSRNRYFLIPLILGFIGGIWQYRNHQKHFWVIFTFFVFTGIAIVLYLNQYPNQPRERDYSYAASFYAFAIWIGLSAMRHGGTRAQGLGGIGRWVWGGVALLVPALMIAENYDDHDRSGRYFARDFAYDYLNSCAPNAILFTNGDNDTFPLWYTQEVEGIRTDVRVICLPYLATDWYIDQMKKKVRDSEPVPFSLDDNTYAPGKRDYIYVYERMKDTVELGDIVRFVASDNPETKLPLQDGSYLDYLPARNLKLTIDRQKVLSTGTVPVKDAGKIVPEMTWKITRGSLYKNDLMILDLIASNQWERPVYFTSINHENILGLQQYFRLEGFTYRLVPVRNEDSSGYTANINTTILYDRLMNTFRWGNMDRRDVLIDSNTYRTTLILRIRNKFASLSEQLLAEGKRDSALAVADRAFRVLPVFNFPHDLSSLQLAEVYYKAGSPEKGNALIREYAEDIRQELVYCMSVDEKFGGAMTSETEQNLAVLEEMVRIAEAYNQGQLIEDLNGISEKLIPPS